MLRKHCFLSVLFAFTLLCSGCELLDDIFKQEKETTEKEKEEEKKKAPEKEKPVVFDRARYKHEKEAWQKLGITNYSFVYDASRPGNSYDKYKVKFTVLDNKPVSAEPPDHRFLENLTMDDVFDAIKNDVDNWIPAGIKSDNDIISVRVKVEYNADYHYPTYIHYGYIYREPMDGDNFGVAVKDFTPFPLR